jgi:predicted N-acyltransferase
MSEKWDKLKPEIERICLRRGIPKVANAIPANPATVYRLLNNETSQPSRAVEAGIERIVEREQRNED